MIVKALAHVLSFAGSGARLSILIFHRVLARPDRIRNWDLDALEFGRTLRWLKGWFNVLPLDAEFIVGRLNQKLIGWANYFYFCLGPVSPAYRAINTHATQRLRRSLCKKHKVPGKGHLDSTSAIMSGNVE